MATTPIEMPQPLPIRSKVFSLNYRQNISFIGPGFSQTLERGVPAWSAKYTSSPLSPARYQTLMAFLLKLDGASGTFLGFDPRYEMPHAYSSLAVTEDPWTQAGQTAPRVTAANYANSTLTVDRLASSAIITPTDYISVKVGECWHLFRITAVSSIVSNTATVYVKPRPLFEGSANLPADVRYRRACCEMRFLPPYTETDSVDTLPIVEFNAVQFFSKVVS